MSDVSATCRLIAEYKRAENQGAAHAAAHFFMQWEEERNLLD